MEELSRDDVIRRTLKTYFDGDTSDTLDGIDDIDAEINLLIEDAFVEVHELSRDANNIFLSVSMTLSNDVRVGIIANLIWDDENEEWVTFFDGSGPDDSYFEPDGEGGYQIVRL